MRLRLACPSALGAAVSLAVLLGACAIGPCGPCPCNPSARAPCPAAVGPTPPGQVALLGPTEGDDENAPDPVGPPVREEIPVRAARPYEGPEEEEKEDDGPSEMDEYELPKKPGGGALLATPLVPVATEFEPPAGATPADCPPQGDADQPGSKGDPALNRQKNRDAVVTAKSATVTKILALKTPAGTTKKHRDTWAADARDYVAFHEARFVRIKGYLTVEVRPEGGESCNCHWVDKSAPKSSRQFVDWHMWLTKGFGDPRTEAMVVEASPRIRWHHPKWDRVRLMGDHVKKDRPVRISGWLLYDQEHPEQVASGQRGTLWEIHPITRIEVWDDATGKFVDMAALP